MGSLTKEAVGRMMDVAACRSVTQELIEDHPWVLAQEDELLAWLLDSIPAGAPPAQLARVAYSVALYEAIRQREDSMRREGAWAELSRFLYRVAHNKWPELAEDATQRALTLVFEQLDRCRGPDTFLGFAFFKLLQAFKAEQRARKEETHQQIEAADAETRPETIESRLVQGERLKVLLDAIARLPDERRRKVIILKFFGGLNDEDIAARLQITANYVRVLRYHGVARLRQDQRLRDWLDNVP